MASKTALKRLLRTLRCTTLQPDSVLQGSILPCEGEANTEVTLVGHGVRSRRVGGFQFDERTPGRYEVVLAPLQPNDEPLISPVDLSQDVAGFLIRIKCN